MTEILQNEEIEFVTPNIYKYSEITKEYLFSMQADIDPEESRIKGYFVPLVPAHSTLLEPPETEIHQVAVYSRETVTELIPYEVIDPETGETHTEYKEVKKVVENWEIKPDYRKDFLKVDNDLNVTEIDTIGVIEGYIVVLREYGEEIASAPDWYKIVDGEVVKKSKKEYNKEKADMREADFNKAFFNTSLGYVRRSVSMADGSHKDFLSDLLPVISMGVQSGQAVHILTYDKPPFDEDVTDWTPYQHNVTVTVQFIQECFVQLSNDFLPINEE